MAKPPEVIEYYPLQRIVAEEREEILRAIDKSLATGVFVCGSELRTFETTFERLTGSRHCVGVGNGLDALTLILRALGLGPGDEVIVPGMTFVATFLSVVHAGATPVAVDVQDSTGNLDPEKVEAAISARTRAVVAVHLHGLMADMPSLASTAARHGVFLVEDAAQAHGATRGSDVAGSSGDAAAFSFYPTKNLGALGDGGCITTNNEELADAVRELSNYGSIRLPSGEVTVGVNSRLDSIQASILQAGASRLAARNLRRTDIANRYLVALENASGCRPLARAPATDGSAWHHFVVLAENREAVRRQLRGLGIQSTVHYSPPPYALPELADLVRVSGEGDRYLSVCERLSAQSLSLPLHPWLYDDEIERITGALSEL